MEVDSLLHCQSVVDGKVFQRLGRFAPVRAATHPQTTRSSIGWVNPWVRLDWVEVGRVVLIFPISRGLGLSDFLKPKSTPESKFVYFPCNRPAEYSNADDIVQFSTSHNASTQ